MAFISTFPLSSTWVFLGPIGGREIALRIKEQAFGLVFRSFESGSLGKIIGSTLWKTFVGVLMSLVAALSIQPLVQLTGS